jgi:septum site-determining protein MinC
VSIKALIETMDSEIEFISTSSEVTTASAKEVGIEISQLSTTLPALDINATEEKNHTISEELITALDKIFGDGDFDTVESDNKTISDTKEINAESAETVSDDIDVVTFDEAEDLEELRKHDRETENLPTLYIHRTLRSGQSIKSDGNIVIIGDVNPGAEVIAKGDITVWGILSGIAKAGSDGNTYSKIRALKLNAIQIKIGDVFARRPDTVNTPYIHRTDTYVPEEARVSRNHIVIYKLHEA